ncbi:MAG TPA: WYL domain-containing protein [Longimicrobiales bacterium]|nr:WYL domain-containing protein [Longimicrobiales bacterium]
MSDRITKLQRWLDLLAFLAVRRFPVSFEQIREGVPAYVLEPDADEKRHEAVRRMFERDKDELQELGIPLESTDLGDPGESDATGYRLRRAGFHLPYLRILAEAGEAGKRPPITPVPGVFSLTRDEAGSALAGLSELASMPGFPLAEQARSAFRKLAFDLEPEARSGPPLVYAQDPEVTATAATLRRLSDALLRRKRVRMRYRSMERDAEEERDVDPYGLLFQHGRWYLVAQDEGREEPRMFRVGRMRDVKPNARQPGTPDFDVPEDFDLASYSGRSAWEMGEDPEGTVEAEVLFAFPRSLWAERNAHGTLVAEHDDGSQVRRFTVYRRDPFLRWVLSMAGDARVTHPPELRDAFRAMAREALARYGETNRA